MPSGCQFCYGNTATKVWLVFGLMVARTESKGIIEFAVISSIVIIRITCAGPFQVNIHVQRIWA